MHGNGLLMNENIELMQSPAFCNKTISSRLISWLKYILFALPVLFRIKSGDKAIITTNPPILQLLMPVLRLRGVDVTFWVLDLYPNALWCGTSVKERSIVPIFWKLLNRLTFVWANELVSLSNSMCNALKRYLPFFKHKNVHQISTWVNHLEFKPVPRGQNEVLKELNLYDRFVVLYSGNVGATHDLSFLPKLATHLIENERVVFLVVGRGQGCDILKKECEHLANVAFLPPQPIEKLGSTMSAGYVGLVSQGDNTGGISMPSKTYYYMACGCALMGVVPVDSGVRDVVERFECGRCFLKNEIKAMADFIRELAINEGLLRKYQANSRVAAANYYSRIRCVNLWVKILNIE